jgi:hypothetical protein
MKLYQYLLEGSMGYEDEELLSSSHFVRPRLTTNNMILLVSAPRGPQICDGLFDLGNFSNTVMSSLEAILRLVLHQQEYETLMIWETWVI